MNESLDKVRTYVGSDGKLHFVDASGADSVLPFSSGLPTGKFTVPYWDNVTVTLPTDNYNMIICIDPHCVLMSTFHKASGRIWRVTVNGSGSQSYSNGGNSASGIKSVSGNQMVVGDDGYFSGEWTYIIY